MGKQTNIVQPKKCQYVNSQSGGAKIFQKSSSHLKILNSRRKKLSMFHTEHKQIRVLSATAQNLVAWATEPPGLLNLLPSHFILTLRKFIRSKAVDTTTVIVLVRQNTETAERHLQFVTNSKKFALPETGRENYSKLHHVNLYCPLRLLTAGVRELHFIFGLTTGFANLYTE